MHISRCDYPEKPVSSIKWNEKSKYDETNTEKICISAA